MTFENIFSEPCDVTFDPEDHSLNVKEDGRERGLWIYCGPPVEHWDHTGIHPVLLTWEQLEKLEQFLKARRERRPR